MLNRKKAVLLQRLDNGITECHKVIVVVEVLLSEMGSYYCLEMNM